MHGYPARRLLRGLGYSQLAERGVGRALDEGAVGHELLKVGDGRLGVDLAGDHGWNAGRIWGDELGPAALSCQRPETITPDAYASCC